MRKGGSCAIITNSCINFVIYCFVGRTFRSRFISTFSIKSSCCAATSPENTLEIVEPGRGGEIMVKLESDSKVAEPVQ